jgi:nitrile hydratase beta subunit
VFGLNLVGAGGAARNIDHFRHAVERIDPVAYLTQGYYGRWLGGVETIIVEAGLLDRASITQRAIELGGNPDDRIASRPSAEPDRIDYEPTEPGNRRLMSSAARFDVGDRVRTRNRGTRGHTRLPGYARGRRGVVVSLHDGWVFPDTNAHGRGENPQHLYTVAFEGSELWGEDAEPGVVVHLDLFEPYLVRADD